MNATIHHSVQTLAATAWCFGVTLLASLLMFILPARADEAPPRTITTTGSAVVYVTPDEAELRFDVHTFDAALPASKELNDKAAAEVLAFLTTAGIEAKDVQTSSAQSSAVYEWREENNRQVRGPVVGYDVRRAYGVKLRDIGKLGAIYDKLLPDSRVTIRGHTLTTSELRKHRDEARLSAARAAREKAAALAGALDARLGAVREIVESNGGHLFAGIPGNLTLQGFSGRGGDASGGGEGSDVSPVGQIEVRAEVTATFDLEPQSPTTTPATR